MQNRRFHGKPPYSAAVLHGGPGAFGSVAPVARGLSDLVGVMEPFQTAETVDGQIAQVHEFIQEHCQPPVSLIGHSWGAWLAAGFAAKHPDAVRQAILIGCGPFESHYAQQIMPARLLRIPEDQRERCQTLMDALHSSDGQDKSRIVAELGPLMESTDVYDALPDEPVVDEESIPWSPNSFADLMEEAMQLRCDGVFLEWAKAIQCPVTAIHGAYDPHPAAGVREPLAKYIDDFTFVLLDKCGHDPWRERYAKDQFFATLRNAVMSV